MDQEKEKLIGDYLNARMKYERDRNERRGYPLARLCGILPESERHPRFPIPLVPCDNPAAYGYNPYQRREVHLKTKPAGRLLARVGAP